MLSVKEVKEIILVIYQTLVKPNAEITKTGYSIATKISEISKYLQNNNDQFYMDSHF